MVKKNDGLDFEVHDAYHTLRHAHKIIGNKSLMQKVKAHHLQVKADHASFDHMANRLAKSGKISSKAMSKMKAPKLKKLKTLKHF